MSLWLTHPLFLPSLIVGVTIVLWATSLLPEFITALLFFAAAMMAKIAPPEVIFGGFASSAFWLVFSGFVLGIAIRKTGLADRAAQALSARLTDSWPRMVASVVLLSYALAFVMPSNMGRIALLMPIVAAMARRAGIADGSRGWFGLALAVGFGTFQLSATILPANVPNLVMSGAAEGSYGIHLNYVPYLLLHTPVLGWLKGAVLVTLICWLFPGKPHRPRDLAPLPPMSRDEKRLAWLLAVVLSLWVTESWHGVGPAWTGLAAAVITLLPRVGFINGEEFASGVNMRTCIYVAGILGLAIAVTQTGIGGAVGNALLQVMPLDKDNPFTSFLALTGITSALNFIMTANGVPALYTTFAQSFADATGFPLLSVIMIQVLGYSHAAAALSGVADRGGDGVRQGPGEGGDATVSGAGGGELSDFTAAGLRLVSAVGETVTAKESPACAVLGRAPTFCQSTRSRVATGKSELRFFRCFCCFNDHRESVSFQGGAANQRAVDVRLGEQLCGVASVNGTAVLDDHLLSDFGVSFSNVVTDEFVHRLRLSRGR